MPRQKMAASIRTRPYQTRSKGPVDVSKAVGPRNAPVSVSTPTPTRSPSRASARVLTRATRTRTRAQTRAQPRDLTTILASAAINASASFRKIDLLDLPIDILLNIVEQVLHPWSLALLPESSRWTTLLHDPALSDMRPVGEFSVCGPPGVSLALTCRLFHDLIIDRIGENFTGKAYVGELQGLWHGKPGFPTGFHKWYPRVNHVICPFAQNFYSLDTRVLGLFGHIKAIDVVMAETIETHAQSCVYGRRCAYVNILTAGPFCDNLAMRTRQRLLAYLRRQRHDAADRGGDRYNLADGVILNIKTALVVDDPAGGSVTLKAHWIEYQDDRSFQVAVLTCRLRGDRNDPETDRTLTGYRYAAVTDEGQLVEGAPSIERLYSFVTNGSLPTQLWWALALPRGNH